MAREPAYVKALNDFAKGDASIDDLDAMEKEFYGENDRSCGILMVSLVENGLETTLRRTLVRGKPHSDLFGFEGGLGTFSSKIAMAYAIGLFGTKTNHDLSLIRLLRNKFAHCRRPLKFSTPVVKNVCASLQLPEVELGSYTIQDRKDSRQRFIGICLKINFHLLHFAHLARPYPQRSQLP